MPITHIRILKYEAKTSTTEKNVLHVSIVLSLTSDLGDTTYPRSTRLLCTLSGLSSDQSIQLEWSGTSNVQKYNFKLPYKHHKDSIDYQIHLGVDVEQASIRNDSRDLVSSFIGNQSLILPLTFKHIVNGPFEGRITRSFVVQDKTIDFEEETKSSIVAHVWDGGLLLSSLIAALAGRKIQGDTSLDKLLQLIETALRKGANVLELGTGVGLLGLVCSHLHDLDITLTDLSTAKELVNSNMVTAKGQSQARFAVLDWDNRETAQGLKNKRAIDVLIMSDVTYNDASHEALWATISALSSQQTKIIFASKYRHASERSFIERLRNSYRVLASTAFDGTSFECKADPADLGDVEILVLGLQRD